MVLLNAGETILRQAAVTRINPQGSRDGTLTLTNQRLVFEAQIPGGLGSPSITRTTINAPLGIVRNASVPKPLLGASRLEVELPQQVGLFQLDDADGWYQALAQARAAAPPMPPGAGMGPRMGPGMGPRRGMGPGGGMGGGMRGGMGGGWGGAPSAPAVVLRCRYCGNLNPPTATKCESCGAGI
jgi:hypothetical protein